MNVRHTWCLFHEQTSEFPPKYPLHTQKEYAQLVSPFLYYDSVAHMLSHATGLSKPVPVFDLWIGLQITGEFKQTYAQYWSEIVTDARYAKYFAFLVQLAAFNYQKTTDERSVFISVEDLRRVLHAVQAWIMFAAQYPKTLHDNEDISNVFTGKRSQAWVSLTKTHSLLCDQLKRESKVVKDLGPFQCTVGDKKLSNEYLVELYSDHQREFNNAMRDPRELFNNVLTVDFLARRLLRDRTIDVSEDQGTVDSSTLCRKHRGRCAPVQEASSICS
ncbi:uncharacterized protein KNAG_0C00140 [Huiozyma naganishii CBS 8797]|uniref:Uncharacterized protein n=1 Tax=Huiozyma naganishii (strain ATCC MYA-139 / BCRC 22969 / CBS 8797 / KCTC 17520 / NBRC 10181 / NCYC 3082 / Yp74L-3) TaxID=1071383 RepID=J7S474_HUIN7|nr:hypothetical protein KNAG_0C00140 [Kazachstania naganishii CBS 8797]CCK69129.1 hypothetical protein KNAG_0C00140 [Kazachstania naganishii CBS 8797]